MPAVRSSRTRRAILTLLVAGVLLLGIPVVAAAEEASQDVETPEPRKLPEFDEPDPARWLNTEPLTLDDLAGKVVLIEFWTLGCDNCTRTIPWIRKLDRRFGKDGLVIVGVHTPEFDFERDPDRLRAFVDKHGISFPVFVDNDYRYWNKLENRYWPAFYFVDREGTIRYVGVGETRVDDRRARELEKKIKELLAEGAP